MSATRDTPALRRTRASIVAAALALWSRDSSATLDAIAGEAGVGRTTLHRHFADRTALIAAVDAHVREEFRAAAARSRPESGTGLEAYGRLLGELLALGAPLGLIFADNALIDPDAWPEDEQGGDIALIERGQRDGSIAPDLPPGWIATIFWTTLFGAHLYVRSGEATQHETTALAIGSLTRALAA